MDFLTKIRDIREYSEGVERRFERAYNISVDEGLILFYIRENSQLRSGNIAEIMNMSAPNASKVLASMESRNIIKRAVGQTDRRQMNFTLTEKGRNILGKIDPDQFKLPAQIGKLLKKSM